MPALLWSGFLTVIYSGPENTSSNTTSRSTPITDGYSPEYDRNDFQGDNEPMNPPVDYTSQFDNLAGDWEDEYGYGNYLSIYYEDITKQRAYAIWQLAREMRMASKTSQIIVSTQFPLLFNEFSCEDIITAEYDTINQCSTLRRHKEADLQDWLHDYNLGDLWQKNVLGGLPL